ncbi:LOW QUALITY PROTEIN: hypothetical protein CRUP_003861 [Coryphaenoides rupestris]|nr:LOW QUALITY PROTEIN: hypothetical protein CRUP_003861 [Coryphaenoides rupestris]
MALASRPSIPARPTYAESPQSVQYNHLGGGGTGYYGNNPVEPLLLVVKVQPHDVGQALQYHAELPAVHRQLADCASVGLPQVARHALAVVGARGVLAQLAADGGRVAALVQVGAGLAVGHEAVARSFCPLHTWPASTHWPDTHMYCRGAHVGCGVAHCRSASSEPSAQTCPSGQIKCENTNICIHSDDLCNGCNNCGDNSDENPLFCAGRTCASDEFRCDSWLLQPLQRSSEWMQMLVFSHLICPEGHVLSATEPEKKKNSSEPSWQSGSPSHVQRAKMQAPLRQVNSPGWQRGPETWMQSFPLLASCPAGDTGTRGPTDLTEPRI